jgi:hypothetical protein
MPGNISRSDTLQNRQYAGSAERKQREADSELYKKERERAVPFKTCEELYLKEKFDIDSGETHLHKRSKDLTRAATMNTTMH